MPTSECDIIICFGVLAHVENLSVILKKMAKLINQNCVLYIQFTDWDKFISKLLAFKQVFKKKNKYNTNRTRFENLQSLIVENNLRIVKSINYYPVLRLMSILSIQGRFAILKWLLTSPFAKFGSEVILEVRS